jgi:hypothetical protein
MGFFLTFAPLFAKCWRIYKIFMRKEMTVIRITVSTLLLNSSSKHLPSRGLANE